jgi:cellular nucleic acid-binding protein
METLYVLQLANGKYYVGKTADMTKRFDQHKKGAGSAWTALHKPIRIVETRPLTGSHDETNTTKDLMKKYGIDNVRGGAYTAVDLPGEQEDMIRHEIRASSDTCYKCGKHGHFANRCAEEEEVVWACNYCSREFATESSATSHEHGCKFKRVAAMSSRQKSVERKSGGGGACSRCGRTGHFSPDCYASTHAKGGHLVDDNESSDDSSDSSSDDDEFVSYNRGSYAKPVPRAVVSPSGCCYRCGRAGHYASNCYARTDTDGDRLD